MSRLKLLACFVDHCYSSLTHSHQQHPGSTRSDTFVNSNKSHRSKGNISTTQSAAQKAVEKIKKTNSQVMHLNIQDMRKKKPTGPVVSIHDLVLVAQNNKKIEEEIGLVAATDAGSFWYIDWMRDNTEEIYYCHAGSPETGPGGVQGISPHPSRNCIFATCGEDRMISVWDASTRWLKRERGVGVVVESMNVVHMIRYLTMCVCVFFPRKIIPYHHHHHHHHCFIITSSESG
jgi:hypothetical protein